MGSHKYNDEEFITNFESLRISYTKRKHKRAIVHSKKQYDENYFPKAKSVKLYYDRGVNRPFWVNHPNEKDNNAWKMIRIYSRKGRNAEFDKVTSPIRNSFRTLITIDSVYKVCNEFLKCQYLLKKIQKQESMECKEMIMYHATLPEYVESICTHNFNWRYSGSSKGSKYGCGVNFSPDPKFAHQFCKNKKLKVVIVSKVLISWTHIGSPNLDLPKTGFDTTCSPKKTVYTKFEDCEFYPEYVVYYTKAN
ncbi:hypothetical protein WA026_018752 [Henosepilachna vigintioctopunctata]|uniref:Poly [ADP-ribose] polymerase n=1 Tax=Henosepilachna vigintioctopunctata TaxID=420089 RepID=A0AAW1TQK5_9CUCU